MAEHCRKLRAVLTLAALCVLPLAGTPARAQNMPTIMPASEVKAGMSGYGVTTLEGDSPERFRFEVLGVLRGAFPKGDMILIRMSGPVIDEAGVIAGMSGSPVYLDDKLVGAVAYGWRYCQVPLAGVTPAEEMLGVQQIDERASAAAATDARAAARAALQRRFRRVGQILASPPFGPEADSLKRQAILPLAVPPALRGPVGARRQVVAPGIAAGLLPEGADPALQPLPLPLAVSGPAGSSGSLLNLLRAGGLTTIEGVARDTDEQPAAPAVTAGTPVGAVFITGDMSVSGMGTLTWTDGKRAVAYGHPMFGLGDVDYPLAIGHVEAVVPSMLNSFRLTSAGRIVGRITQDREPAIAARLDETSPMFPCSVRIRGTVEEDYNYRVAAYWNTAPFFASYAVEASSSRWEGSGTPYMLKAGVRIKVSGRDEPIVMSNEYASYSALPPSADLVEMPLSQLVMNTFEEVQIEGVDYELEVTPGFEAATIESVWADRAKAAPGEEVSVIVTLKEHRGKETVRRVTVPIPTDAQPGTQAEILVCDAMTDRTVESRLDPGFFAPQSLEGIVDVLERIESNRSLVVRASFARQGVRYGGEAMPDLPQSTIQVMGSGPSDGRATSLLQDERHVVETPWVLTGAQIIPIEIKEPEPYRP